MKKQADNKRLSPQGPPMTSDEIACIGRICDELANLKVGSMSRRLEADMMALGVENLHDLAHKLSQMLLRNGFSLVVFGGGGGGGTIHPPTPPNHKKPDQP